jgi:hypothetical protein
MAEYIKREATIKAIVDSRNRYYNSASNQYLVGRCDGLDIAAGLLRVAPAADVAPVVHGRWSDAGFGELPKHAPYGWACSVCGGISFNNEYIYCPNCGAKMDGGNENV